MKPSMKENKRLAVGDSTTDCDLDAFVTKPGTIEWLGEEPVLPNTQKCTVWALRTFTDWRDGRNKCSNIQSKYPLGLLENPDVKNWIAGYFASSWKPAARTVSHTYPTRMLYVLAALLSYGCSKSKLCPNLMDKNDPCLALCCRTITQGRCWWFS